MEITHQSELNDATIFTLEMHSFLNILSVLSGILQYFRSHPECQGYFDNEIESIRKMIYAIDNNHQSEVSADGVEGLKNAIIDALNRLRSDNPDYAKGGDYADLTEPLDEVLGVVDIRIAELRARGMNPDQWQLINTDEYLTEFHHFFLAVQKNSLGRYRIIHNLADHRSNDYLVNIKIDSDTNNAVPLTILLKDIITKSAPWVTDQVCLRHGM